MLVKTTLVAIFVTALCHLSEQSPNFYMKLRRFGGSSAEPSYRGCGDTYQCFGLPDDCVADKKCTVLLKTQPLEGESGAQFRLFWKRDENSTDGYVAAALSEDQKMGNDSVTIFTVIKDAVDHQQGYTSCEKHCGVKTGEKVDGINYLKKSYKDGLLEGQWTRAEDTQVEKKTFNLKKTKYFIFLAVGPVDDKGNPQQHSAKTMSKAAYDLEQVVPTPAPTTLAPTTVEPTTDAAANSTTAAETGTAGTTEKAGTTPAPTGTGSATAGTGTGTPKATTSRPKTTTPGAKGSAASVTLNLALTALFALKIFY